MLKASPLCLVGPYRKKQIGEVLKIFKKGLSYQIFLEVYFLEVA